MVALEQWLANQLLLRAIIHVHYEQPLQVLTVQLQAPLTLQ